MTRTLPVEKTASASASARYWALETPIWEQRLQRLARSMFQGEPGIIEVAIEQARRRVMDKALAGTLAAPSDAYLLTLLKRELIDFSKARYGYRRPPVWVQRLGRIWETVYHLLCVLKRLPEEISVALVEQQLGRAGKRLEAVVDATEAIIQAAIREILRQERDCQQAKAPPMASLDQPAPVPSAESDEGAAREMPQPASAIDQVLSREDLEHILEALRVLLAGGPSVHQRTGRPSERILVDLERFAAHLALSDRERLVLRLVYQEGLSTHDAAQALREPAHSIRRLRRKALEKIAAAFTQAGVENPLQDLGLI